jgi:hypothetical protein
MCSVLQPPGVNPVAFNKYINTINRARNDPRGGVVVDVSVVVQGNASCKGDNYTDSRSEKLVYYCTQTENIKHIQ